MKTIKDHHQPFLFYKDTDLKIITSKFLNQTYEIKFGRSIAVENVWKLYIVDYDTLVENELSTPINFSFKGNFYKRFAECNGFVHLDNGNYKISYVVGIHNGKDDSAPLYVIATGDLDLTTNCVRNVKILEEIDFNWSGFVYKNYFIYNYYNNILIENEQNSNDIKSESLDPCFDSFSRITGIWGDDNTLIVTGFNQSASKNFKSFFYNISAKQFSPIIHNSSSLIYKCSVIKTNTNTELLAWTDKVFNVSGSTDYFLNIDVL